MATFEELLEGKDISELDDAEIQDIVTKLNSVELERFEQEIKAKTPSRRTRSKKEKASMEAFDALIAKGLRKGA